MGMLDPLMSLGLGRSPYDLVVMGEGPEDPRTRGQLYDDRGRPINPETKRINRDVVRSHNEVMMVIGVAEPDNGHDTQLEAAQRHRRYENRVGGRLLLTGSVLQTAAIWGVNGMRQRILLYKPFSQTTFYGMFQLVWRQQSLSSYLLNGLPSFLTSSILEQFVVAEYKKDYPIIRHVASYIRLHLAIYTFFQRTGILPWRPLLPNWRFFILGTSLSPIPIPSLPSSLRPRGFLGWLGAVALGVAPFVGFWLYTRLYNFVTGFLRIVIHQSLPRPYNPHKRRNRQPPSPELIPIEVRTEGPELAEPALPSSPGGVLGNHHHHHHQNTTTPTPTGPEDANPPTLPSTPATPTAPAPGIPHDDFASDDEDTEIISATLISFDVESTEPMPDPETAGGAHNAGDRTNNSTPGVWAAELRPSFIESHGVEAAAFDSQGTASGSGDGDLGGGSGGGGSTANRPTYRDSLLMRLPAMLATDVLAITSARLLVAPLASAVWLGLARPYMARRGLSMEGVVDGPGRWWGLSSGRALVNFLGLELLLAVVHGEAWAMVMLLAERFRYTEEEWLELEREAGLEE
ncbi:hypothetical protein VTJ49DRAFT_2482 [Mycothermus thermophilus]|uniref:Uncharacterized protein n=1 Tax=Humicola insolens TaxID=85995 RepID=A0ABR3V9U9_HUMIN